MTKVNHRDRSRTYASKREKLVDRHNRPPNDQGPWTFVTMEFLISPAFRSLSVNASRVHWRIVAEYLAKGRKDNGSLEISHPQFREAGCCADLVADAIDELIYKGLIRVQRGRAADGTPYPNRYRLTWVGNFEGSAATNDWKRMTPDGCAQWSKVRAERRLVRSKKNSRKTKRQSDFSESRQSDFSESGGVGRASA